MHFDHLDLFRISDFGFLLLFVLGVLCGSTLTKRGTLSMSILFALMFLFGLRMPYGQALPTALSDDFDKF